jgi:hypothetical protein
VGPAISHVGRGGIACPSLCFISPSYSFRLVDRYFLARAEDAGRRWDERGEAVPLDDPQIEFSVYSLPMRARVVLAC